MATTDLHGHIRGYDYFADRPCDRSGLARLASRVEQARASARNTLLFDSGDFLQGTPLTQLWGEKSGSGRDQPHPVIAAMNTVGYDAATLGNHEFDFGLDFALRAIETAQFPIVSSNLHPRKYMPSAGDGARLPLPWLMLERQVTDREGTAHSLKIAVVGVLPPMTLEWAPEDLAARMDIDNIVPCLKALVPRIRARQPDLLVALAHSAITPLPPLAAPERERENAVLALAEIDGIDVILSGHDHLPFPDRSRGVRHARAGIDPVKSTLMGKPTLNAGANGRHLGVMDLVLEKGARGWEIVLHHCELRAAAGPYQNERPDVLRASEAAHHETLRYIRRKLGKLAAPMHSYFALLGPDPSLSFAAQAQYRAARTLLSDHPEAPLPLLSAVSPFKAGGWHGANHYVQIPAGPLRMSHLDDLYLFNDTLGLIEVTGATLRDWLEHSASVFRQIKPGLPAQPLHDPAFPSYSFDVIFGLDYQIDLTQPARYSTSGDLSLPDTHRIRDLCCHGSPVRDEDSFMLATNSFRLNGGGHFPIEGKKPNWLDTMPRIRELLIAEIRRDRLLQPQATPVWRFAPCPRTSVIAHTNPAARTEMNLLRKAGMVVEPRELGTDGFLGIELFL